MTASHNIPFYHIQPDKMLIILIFHVSNYIFSGVETASHTGYCKLKPNCIQSIWEQDKGGENKSKCLVVGSMFPHYCIY